MSVAPDRRQAVPFDPEHFAGLARQGTVYGLTDTFRHAYRNRLWGGSESVSGEGASGGQTRVLRQSLPGLLTRLGVRTLLDLPCGDLNWMADVPLDGMTYIGGDLVPELIEANRARHHASGREFRVLDLTSSPLPAADLLLCRDCLVHLSIRDIARALVNIRRAPIRFLLTTTFPDERHNRDITTGDWRPLNLQAGPFDFPEPILLLNEGCTEGGGRFGDKSLGLWENATLPDCSALTTGPEA